MTPQTTTSAATTHDDTTAEPATAPLTVVHPAGAGDAPWWRHAVVYQIYPRSWADSDGDGMGDLPGITAHLPYLRDLGVDAIWLSPFYVSPMNDAGYDVADYRDIDPRFGTLDDADTLIATAHDLGLKVLIDLVPNHSSSEHPWFAAALAAGPGSPERARYIFREGRGENGELPPNNWPSVFGGRGWSRVTEADGSPGQWYLHLFDTTQPDFDWRNPDVRAEFLSVISFWVERGADGFRVDVAHGLVKDPALPDWDGSITPAHDHDDEPLQVHQADGGVMRPMWDQDEVHEIYRSWRALLDSFGEPDRILCAEAWVEPEDRLARYVRPDEMHQTFNFPFLQAHWRAARLSEVIEESYAANGAVGAPTTWVLSNHDVVRHVSRLGLDQSRPMPHGIRKEDPQPDLELGLRRARAATTLMLALPGGAYLYQGEELGLPEATELPDEVRQDPSFHRTGGEDTGRDGCRVPVPWVKDAPSFGFGPSERTWLPQPASYGDYAVDQQDGVAGSTLELYRSLLASRRADRMGHGALSRHPLASDDVVAYVNGSADGARNTLVVVNLGEEPVALPSGAEVIIASGPLTDDGTVPLDTAVWARL